MVQFVLLAVTMPMKVELRCASTTTGGLSVMMIGTSWKPRWSADSLTSAMDLVNCHNIFAVLV